MQKKDPGFKIHLVLKAKAARVFFFFFGGGGYGVRPLGFRV